jgi:glycosyltransferase involved in cell wall biosynthesis
MVEAKEPKVSIGIPFYNEEAYLTAALNSAVTQHYKNIEIIVADNCSTDGSANIAREFAKADPRILLHRHQVNKGPAYNFRFVLEQANSKYFVWLGGHDIFLPNYISDAVQLLEANPAVVLAYPRSREIGPQGDVLSEIDTDYDTSGMSYSEGLLKICRNFHNGYVIHGVFRTEVLKKLPFEKVVASDLLMVMVASLNGIIQPLPTFGFHRRTVRHETAEEQMNRHQSQGLYKQDENPFALLFVILSKHILVRAKWPIQERIKVIITARKILTRRFKVRPKGVLKAALKYFFPF